jgi:hypothetical protein
VSSLLAHPAAVEHEDVIGQPHGREPLRYEDGDGADAAGGLGGLGGVVLRAPLAPLPSVS